MKDRNGIEIKVGDMVTWVAEASGFKKGREGRVVEMVPKGCSPKTKLSTGTTVNSRSDRVVVECEHHHSKGVKKEYLTPVVSRVTVVQKLGAFLGGAEVTNVGEYEGIASPLDGPSAAQSEQGAE